MCAHPLANSNRTPLAAPIDVKRGFPVTKPAALGAARDLTRDHPSRRLATMRTSTDRPQPRVLAVTATLVVVLALPGCAIFSSKSAEDSSELPATIAAHHEAIEVERARLKDLVAPRMDPSKDPSRDHTQDAGAEAPIQTEDMIAIAQRLSRLQASLERLEAEADAKADAKSEHPAP